MKSFRPYALVLTDNGNKIEVYKKYGELKKDLKRLYSLAIDQQVIVARYKKGGWGEFIEKWTNKDGKMKIFYTTWRA